MTTDWMITAHYPHSKKIPAIWKFLDPKHWIIAREKGKTGKPHIQARVKTSRTSEEVKKWLALNGPFLGGVDLREAEPKDIKEWEYERKEGLYICSWDTEGARSDRFGTPRGNQIRFLDRLERGGDRTISVWYNRKGNDGKSWLCRHLYENGRCTYVMALSGNVDRIIKDTVSAYNYSDIILIDLGRAYKWTPQLAETLERLKDGLIRDDRYTNRTINIHGVKVGVMCNTKPNQAWLSEDRWDIMET